MELIDRSNLEQETVVDVHVVLRGYSPCEEVINKPTQLGKKLKAKVTLQQAMKAQISRDVALLSLT
jgi:hypothetical protein